MEHKLNIEGTLHKDLIQPALHRCNAIYVVIILCLMAVGAFGMAWMYHCYELKVISEDQSHIKDVLEMVKRNDYVLWKHYASATNFDKFLLMLEQAAHLEANKKGHKSTAKANVASHSDEENVTIKISDDAKKDEQGEKLQIITETSSSQEKEFALEWAEIVTEATDHQDDKAKGQISENSGSEVFHWKWTLPSSAWLQLSPFMVDYGVEDASTERSNSAYMSSE